METKTALLKALKTMKTEAVSFEQWIDVSDRVGSGNYARWGAKDLIAHTAEWTRMRALKLQGSKDESSNSDEHAGDLNRTIFERHLNTQWKDVFGMLVDNITVVEAESQKRSENQLIEPDAEGNDRPVWWGIAFYGIVHNLTHIGQALIRSGSGKQAIALIERMEPLLLQISDLDLWKGMIAYNVGRIYALTGETDAAVNQLRKAIDLMPNAATWIQNDEDFEGVRGSL